MAIYHFSGQVIKRSAGRSAVACAAYRSGDELHDERENKTFKFKRDVQPSTFIMLPKHAPIEYKNRNTLWNAVEKVEKRSDAQLSREFNVALPVELTYEQQEELTKKFVQDQFVNRGMIADVAIHHDDENNPHFHVMLTMRPMNKDGTWGKKRDGNKKVVDWDSRLSLETWRKEWANYANRALEHSGNQERIDHRSLKDQGIQQLPKVHMGKAIAIEKKAQLKANREGRPYTPVTRQGIYNQLVEQYNQSLTQSKNLQEKKVHVVTSALNRHAQQILTDQWYWNRMDDRERLASTYVANRIKNDTLNPYTLEQSMGMIYGWEAKLDRTREELYRERLQGQDNAEEVAKWEKQYEQFLKVHGAYETVKNAFERLSIERVVDDYQAEPLREKLTVNDATMILQHNFSTAPRLEQNQIDGFLQQQQNVLALQEHLNRSSVSLTQAVYYRDRLGGLEYRVHQQRELTNEALQLYKQEPTKKYFGQYKIAKSKLEDLQTDYENKKDIAEKAIHVLYEREKEGLANQGVNPHLVQDLTPRDYVRVKDELKNYDNVIDLHKTIEHKRSFEMVERRLQGKELTPENVQDLKERIDRWGYLLDRREASEVSNEVNLEREKERYNEQSKAIAYVYQYLYGQQKEQITAREELRQEFIHRGHDAGRIFDNQSVTLKELHEMNMNQDLPAAEALMNIRAREYPKELRDELPDKRLKGYLDVDRVDSLLDHQQAKLSTAMERHTAKGEQLEEAKYIYNQIQYKEEKGENIVEETIKLKRLGFDRKDFEEQFQDRLTKHESYQGWLDEKQVQLDHKKEKTSWLLSHYSKDIESNYNKTMQKWPSDLTIKAKAIILKENADHQFVQPDQQKETLEKGERKHEASKSLDVTHFIAKNYKVKLDREQKNLKVVQKKIENSTGVEKVKLKQEEKGIRGRIDDLHRKERYAFQNQVRNIAQGPFIKGLDKKESTAILKHVEQTGEAIEHKPQRNQHYPSELIDTINAALDRAKRDQEHDGASRFFEQNRKNKRGQSRGFTL